MMDQSSGTGGTRNNDQGNEDTSAAREHVHAAEENRDALEAQNRRTEATTPESVNTPIGGAGGGNAGGGNAGGGTTTSGGQGGMNATGGTRGNDDPSQARENVRSAEENRDALAEQNRRVEASAPDDIDTGPNR
jgi:hypothetical protein